MPKWYKLNDTTVLDLDRVAMLVLSQDQSGKDVGLNFVFEAGGGFVLDASGSDVRACMQTIIALLDPSLSIPGRPTEPGEPMDTPTPPVPSTPSNRR